MGKFRVEEMTCGHCEKAITTELVQGDPKIKVKVNLKEKTIEVENLTNDRVEFLLKEIGYTPKLIK